jgi:Flp pilus assembly pilin Flp
MSIVFGPERRTFWSSAVREAGQDTAEYALLLAFVAVVIAAGIAAFGTSLSGVYTALVAALPPVP